MKLKFKAEKKDVTIFVVFMIALLYLIALAVVNVMAFLNEEISFTLLPLRAFTLEFLPATIFFFLAAVIASFLSVSDHFFTREKGIGFEIGKSESDGYSRWASEKEIKHELKLVNPSSEISDVAGIPLINNGSEIWVDDGESHNLIIGSTGSGKTEMLVQPMIKILAKHGESMIITDPKGEIYENNANELKARGYNIILLNFRDPQKGNCWNPLTLPYSLYKSGDKDKANELLDDLAKNILYDADNKSNDPFWENTSADYFSGLSLALFDDAKEEEINLNSINVMTTVGEEKIKGTNTIYMKEYFSTKDVGSPAYINVASTLTAPSETKGSILSVFKQKIKLFSSRENLSEMLSHSDFDMKDIGRKKTAVFLVIQDEKTTYHSLVTIFIKQCYETLIGVAQENGGRLEYRTNFILDEFANMPPLKDVTTMVTAARSRKIRFNFIIQNFAQLSSVYGKENGDTIKGNCGNLIYLISSEMNALEEISKMCGDKKSKEKDKTASTPLVTVSDLQRLPKWTTILVRDRCFPFKTKMTPNFDLVANNAWGKDYGKADFPTREKQKVPVFDLKGVVDKIREEKINNLLGEKGNMPFGGLPGMGLSGIDKPSMPPFPGLGPKNPFTPDKEGPKGFDVDELVKRIDAKIAELEEEERKEKEAMNQKVEPRKEITEEKIIQNDKMPKILPSQVFDEKEITDDQFFDDFFCDEDE